MAAVPGTPSLAVELQRASGSRASSTLLVVGGLSLLAVAGFLAWRRFTTRPWIEGYRVVKEYPHDPAAYTQGLVFDGGVLHESTGQMRHSSVRTVELESGKVLQKTDLPNEYFGEGLAQVDGRLIQLTWQQGVARIYDKETLKPLDQFEYDGEGWGLVYDGHSLIMSDGTEWIYFRDPSTFKEQRRVRVTSRGLPVPMLNELEMVEGELWANVWKKNYIARIDPTTGNVLGLIDLSGIFDTSSIASDDAVLNGIAYDPRSKRLFVTGKLWPKLFEIEVVPK